MFTTVDIGFFITKNSEIKKYFFSKYNPIKGEKCH